MGAGVCPCVCSKALRAILGCQAQLAGFVRSSMEAGKRRAVNALEVRALLKVRQPDVCDRASVQLRVS